MYQLSVYVHILSAIVWVGGMLFLALVIVPTTRGMSAAERGALLGVIGRRFRVVGWAAITLLIATGIINAGYRGVTWEGILTGQLFASRFGQVLAVKVALVVVMVAISVLHDFFVGPASVRALEWPQHVSAEKTARLRRQASWMGRVSAVLALVVVALGVVLVRPLG